MGTINSIGSEWPIEVEVGGTGVETFTDHGVLVGSGATDITVLTVGTNGQILVGSAGADPVFAAITSTDGSITITGGAGTLVIEGTDATTAQDGVVELATDAEATAGTDTVRAIVPASLKAKLGTQTDHGVLVGSGTAGAVTALAVGTNGQVVVGSTGADPVFATLTSSGGTVTFTPGAGTLNLEAAGGGGGSDFANSTTVLNNGAIYAVYYGAGKWVTCLYDKGISICTSLTGAETNYDPAGVLRNVSIAYDGSTYWTTVGYDTSGYVAYATDPTGVWTTIDSGYGAVTVNFHKVIYGGGYWVAVGGSGYISYSTAPQTSWTSNTQGATAFNSVDYDGTYYVAVGESGVLYYTTDPTGAWTAGTSGVTSGISDIATDGTTWMFVGSAGVRRYTTDPTGAWTALGYIMGIDSIPRVGYSNGNWLIIVKASYDAYIFTATSPSGTWASIDSQTTAPGGCYQGIGHNGDDWMVGVNTGKLTYSF